MINKKLLLFLLLFLLWVLFRAEIPRDLLSQNKSTPQNDSHKPRQRSTHPNLFFDEKTFNEGVARTKKENKLSSYHVAGGIIPHHLFPGFILTDFFNRLAVQKPKTVVLIGPNHYEKGNYKILTSLYSWETPFGRVDPSDNIINELVKKGAVKIDEEVLANDHSAAGMMPFIRYYLPGTNVVPILISGYTTQKEAEALAGSLGDIMDQDTVLVAPVDFSHYLTSKQAKERDEVTLEVLKNYDYRQLFSLNNEYIDSPPSIAVLLIVMQKLGTTKIDILYHTNSGELQRDDYIPTTSYFSIAYY